MPSVSRTARAASTIVSRSSFLGRPRLSVDVVAVTTLLYSVNLTPARKRLGVLTETRRAIVPEDDSWAFHQRPTDPFWNESGLFGFMIPERRIDGYFYVWHRPNM